MSIDAANLFFRAVQAGEALATAVELLGPGVALSAAIWAAIRAWDRRQERAARRAARAELLAETARQHTERHDVGPDALRLLQDLDHHLEQLAAQDHELAEWKEDQ